MGIPRLTSFVNNNFTGWQRKEIEGNLIIDGNNLCHSLYSFDWSHGGQFPEYQDKVILFFTSLKHSGITPIVVMDGIDYKEEKCDTVFDRRNAMIKTIHRHTANVQKRNIEAVGDGVLPSLAYNVFFSVMIELEVKFIVADGEGDDWIYRLASRYSCPVLSADSDFFMYKLKSGYTPFNRFHWEASPINAEVYYYQAFCDQFEFQDEALRLIIPAIVGNDFLLPVDSSSFMSHIARTVALNSREYQRLVQYIKLFRSLEDFIGQIESLSLDNHEKERLRENCLEAQKMYDSDKNTTLEEMNSKTELLAFNSEVIPEWILKQFREGNFSSMEALVLGKSILKIFIDNSNNDSCIHVSLPIRQHIYGLTGSSLVTEYYRERLELVGKGVHSIDFINGHPLPPFLRIPFLRPLEREHLLYSILGSDEQTMQSLHEYWRLVMVATDFWARHSRPSPHLIKALILCFVVCSTCPHELPRMRSQFFIPFEFRRSSKWMPPLHALAQWQSTYMDTISLNQVLRLPLIPVSPAKLYDGKLAMFFALPENGDHLITMLPINRRLYDDLVGVIIPHRPGAYPQAQHQQNVPPRFQNSPKGHQGNVRGRGGGRGRGVGRGHYVDGAGRGQRRGHSNSPRGHSRGHTSNPWGQERSSVGDARNQGPRSTSGQNQKPSQGQGYAKGQRSDRGRPKGIAKGFQAKTVVSQPPKFTHKNRYATLLGDKESDDDSSD